MKTIIHTIKTMMLIAGLMLSLHATASTTVAINSQITFEDDVEDVPPSMPIDGLLGLGLAAGAYLGLRKRFKDAK